MTTWTCISEDLAPHMPYSLKIITTTTRYLFQITRSTLETQCKEMSMTETANNLILPRCTMTAAQINLFLYSKMRTPVASPHPRVSNCYWWWSFREVDRPKMPKTSHRIYVHAALQQRGRIVGSREHLTVTFTHSNLHTVNTGGECPSANGKWDLHQIITRKSLLIQL